MDVHAGDSAVDEPLRYVERMRRRLAWYRRASLPTLLATVPLFAASSRGAHLVALALLLAAWALGAGGLYWSIPLRAARRALDSAPREMLVDRWLRPGSRTGGWRTRLHAPGCEPVMLGSFQLSSRGARRLSNATCLVYGPAPTGGSVVVSIGAFTVVGSVERSAAQRVLAA